MKSSNEITLKVKRTIENFQKILKEKGYINTEHFILYDTFMIPNSLDIAKIPTREIISNAIIIREVEDICENEIRKNVIYKIKKFNERGEIIEQKTIRMKVLDCLEAEIFFQTIGFKKIMNITEEDYGYQKGNIDLTTKDIKNGDKMIEVETRDNIKSLNTVDGLKETLKAENLPLDFKDCFIKKAEIELNKILNRKK